ncbi:TRPM8 channel-associated factor homolog [Macrobrachium nipponense]|uniref:TRPM8 channel-associated factor homolog n=1 Tax=Macrobrachium nipponense TaxID=159736 RepID=UPI0030C82355
MLGAVDSSKTSWNFDGQGVLETNSKALDVPRDIPRTRVILYAKHGGVNQKWWKLSQIKSILQKSPETKASYPAPLVNMADRIIAQDQSCECKELVTGAAFEEPEYLISQSTHACLTVLDSTSPNDTSIGLAPYTGDARQQWYVKEGIWEWGQDRSYCLGPDLQTGMLKLTLNKESNSLWTIDKDGLFVNGHHALDVPWEGDRTKVILSPKNGDMKQKWWRMSNLKLFVGRKIYPLSASDENTYKDEVARGIVNRLCSLMEPLPHPRDIDHYPGTVAPETPRKTLMCALTVGSVQQRSNLRMTVPEDWQATNMYVVAGDIFTITLPNITEKQAEQIAVRVGAHRDCLTPTSPNLQKGFFKRMPVVSEEFDLNPGENRLRSQFGGNLIFTYGGKEEFNITAEVKNIVETPHYILGKSNSTDWKKMKDLDAPFSVLETDKVVLIAPTSEARGIVDIDGLLRRYDDIMTKLEDLSGFTESDPPPQGKQWMVDDVQITAGSAHAGFPAMFDHEFYDLTSPKTPHDWVVWHELGHNYQQGPYWSNAYGSESTVNLFSLYIEEKLKGSDRLKRENVYLPTAQAVDKGLTFEQANYWQQLVFLMEIKHSFPSHGWEMFRHLNRTVRALSEQDAAVLKKTRQNQYDYVYVTLSRFIGTDLLPHYQRWSLPVSEKAQNEVKSLGLPKAPQNMSASSNPEKCIIS